MHPISNNSLNQFIQRNSFDLPKIDGNLKSDVEKNLEDQIVTQAAHPWSAATVGMNGKEALLVGGGPTALMTALTLRSKGYKVTVLEKHNAPNRLSHAFNLTPVALSALRYHGLEKKDLDPYLTMYADGSGSIIIEELEKILEKKAKEVGIRVLRNQEVELIDTTEKKIHVKNRKLDLSYELNLNNYDFVIGADGKNSTVGKLLDFPSHTTGEKAYAMRFVTNQSAPVMDLPPRTPVIDPRFHIRQYVNAGQTYYNALISKADFDKFTADKNAMKATAMGLLKQYHNPSEITEIDVMPVDIGYRGAMTKTFDNVKPVFMLAGDAVAQTNFVLETGFNTHVVATKLLGNMVDAIQKKQLSKNDAIALYQHDNQVVYGSMVERSKIATAPIIGPGSVRNAVPPMRTRRVYPITRNVLPPRSRLVRV